MDDLMQEFVSEIHENLEELDHDLARLNMAPGDKDALARVLRIIHTIKGAARFAGLPELESITHETENTLAGFKANGHDVSASLAQVSKSVRRVRAILDDIAVKQETMPAFDSGSVLWERMPVMMRDLGAELGKDISFEISGDATSVHAAALELVKGPLFHILRNSADHGIETPEVRRATNKSETGKIILTASEEKGFTVIEVRDDGRGISLERVRATALEHDIATAAELRAMPTQQLLQLVFRPGFSTAHSLSALSGRGVGLDAVRTTVEELGGSVMAHSVEGQGSTFTLRIPR